jgi:hypothetical protein
MTSFQRKIDLNGGNGFKTGGEGFNFFVSYFSYPGVLMKSLVDHDKDIVIYQGFSVLSDSFPIEASSKREKLMCAKPRVAEIATHPSWENRLELLLESTGEGSMASTSKVGASSSIVPGPSKYWAATCTT